MNVDNITIDKDSNNNVDSRKVDDDGQEKNPNIEYDDDDKKKPINKLKSKSNLFEITSPYGPMGDQPKAISKLVKQINRDDKYSVLRGCTGTGKTFVMSQVIAQTNRPALILCHNKSLAAQLARELQSHLRNNHIRLFVSYYNHYKPEYYDPIHNKYGSKKSSVNDELDALRHLATESLLQHKDVVIVASVSCIYGLGMPQAYMDASVRYTVGDTIIVGKQNGMRNNGLDTIQTKLESLLIDFETQQKHPPSSTSQSSSSSLTASQSTMYTISSIYHGNSKGMVPMESTTIFPAKHHISGTKEEFEESLKRIEDEVAERYKELCNASKKEEADRISKRVAQDLALLRETGTCPGIENYSRHMALKDANVPPSTLLDYFGLINGDDDNDDDDEGSSDEIKINDDWLLVVDESHVTIPQLKAMYGGDRARKEKLVEHGYRLPSALDNRPLRSEEFWERIPQTLFVSATPSQRELDLISNIPDNEPVDMMIRPTFVCDPHIEVRPIENQLEDLVKEISDRSKRNERTLAMTVTKRDAEDLATYLIATGGVNAMYIHSGLNTHERSKALQALQSGEIDCLVGVNLLREGLDLPQVSLVAILNADFEGFLRSETALLQTIGRAARNINGKAIFYANKITRSMKKCMDATESRRKAQLDYNLKNN
ncbi:P-loop containing nucleoside triphosphate hydrolase protein, partial [Fragilariopsis cylindrus CCMP1102]